MKYLKTALGIILVVVILLIVKQNFLDKNKKIDVTDLCNASQSQVESTLGVKCVSEPSMEENVFEYSKIGGVTVKGDKANGIGVVCLNGFQNGLTVQKSQYMLFNITVGKSRVGMESAMTYQFEETFEIDEGVEKELLGDRNGFPIFYCNWKNNDCVVVTCEKTTGTIVAVTYFNDAKKVTERLDF
ncbi:MAG: hypothetical protein J6B19_03600 [Lachnospiraceae bacterium]|nr:hypothetical protein [Lachnospiraceae bacterium]